MYMYTCKTYTYEDTHYTAANVCTNLHVYIHRVHLNLQFSLEPLNSITGYMYMYKAAMSCSNGITCLDVSLLVYTYL